MIKKIIILISIFLLIGCTKININEMNLEEIIDTAINNDNVSLYNTNKKGYRFFLPSEFSIVKDNDFVQQLVSHNNIYYLNIDLVSYYYKNIMQGKEETSDYAFYNFEHNNNYGYLKIRKNNDYFFVELCYNYAIIEVEVKENELKYAVSRSIMILNSLKYNDLIVEKYIHENDLDSKETVYRIPEPENKDEDKNILQYIEEYEESNEQKERCQ